MLKAKGIFRFCITFLAVVILASACNNKERSNQDTTTLNKEGLVKIARKFSLVRTDSCTILTINDPWQGASGITQVYFLVDRLARKLIGVNESSVIYVPVRNIICMSTTHVAMVTALGEEGIITGVSGRDLIYNPAILKRIDRGDIKDVGYESGMNNELILKLSPDLIMMYGIGSESAGYLGKVKELGTKVMFNADYLEVNPLGKAEWIKLFGALFCKEEMADSIFLSVSDSYQELKTYISRNSKSKPIVLLGLPFRDTWFISPGNSYINRFIEDAGGEYLWRDTKSATSLPYSIEDVYLKSLDADFWLNTGSARFKYEITSVDPRLGSIPCFSKGNIFNNNKRLSVSGSNDYWESGILNPHLILKDIGMILHPELFTDTIFTYYQRIE